MTSVQPQASTEGASAAGGEVHSPSHSPSARRPTHNHPWLFVASLALICLLSWQHQAYYDFENDDAYISYRYAENWAAGRGPVLNAGERVEGYSNFLLIAGLALVARVGGDVVVTSRHLGMLCMFGLVLLGFALVRWRLQRSAVLALAAGAALALHGGLAAWALSGMETVPLACVVLLAQYVFLGELGRRQQHWRSGILFAVVALLRADGFLHSAATALFLLVQRQHRRRLWSFVLAFACIGVPYFAWRWQYYGHFFPNAYYLRTSPSPLQAAVL